jgi:hypothetical protein
MQTAAPLPCTARAVRMPAYHTRNVHQVPFLTHHCKCRRSVSWCTLSGNAVQSSWPHPCCPALGLSFFVALPVPAGPLFAALHSADGDSIIQFMFPPERLPAHTQVRTACRVPAGATSSIAVLAGSSVACAAHIRQLQAAYLQEAPPAA